MGRVAGSALAAVAAVAVAAGAGGCRATPLPPALRQAELLEHDRRYEEALAAYARAERECGSRPRDCVRAALGRAELLDRLQRHDEALRAYQALERDPRAHVAVKARALVHVAELHLRRPDGRAAGEAALWATLQRYPDETAAERALSTLFRRARREGPAALGPLVTRLDALYARLAGRAIGEHLAYTAAEAVALSDPAAALARFAALAERHPRGTRIDDALWRQGQLLRARRDIDGAIRVYGQLVGRYERALIVGSYNSVHMDDAQLAIAEMYLRDKRDPGRALAALDRLDQRFPDSRLRPVGRWLAAEAHLARRDPARACRALGELRQKYPDSRYVRRARRRERALGCPAAR